jgi:hypothetical protein
MNNASKGQMGFNSVFKGLVSRPALGKFKACHSAADRHKAQEHELQAEIQLSTLISSRISSPSPTSPTGSYNDLNLLLQDSVHNSVTVHSDTTQCEQNIAAQNVLATVTALLDMVGAQQFTTT